MTVPKNNPPVVVGKNQREWNTEFNDPVLAREPEPKADLSGAIAELKEVLRMNRSRFEIEPNEGKGIEAAIAILTEANKK